ncbi:MAG: hypothetical protein ACJ79S_01115 [Gemmatimonadaceae bacterium]
MPGRHLPPDHSKGDESTLGGYAAVHARPPAFEGVDGMAYSVDVLVDGTGEGGAAAYGAYLLFMRWRRIGEPGVEGHLETDYLARGATEADARAALAAMPLAEVKATLDALIRERRRGAMPDGAPARPGWEVMRDEGGGE